MIINKVFKCFIEVLNVFNVYFNDVIHKIFLTTDEFKTCIKHLKKPVSDKGIIALPKLTFKCPTITINEQMNVLPRLYCFKIA